MDNYRIKITSANIDTLDVDDLDISVFEKIAEKKNLTHEDEYAIISSVQ
jgi:hypothetical protein